MPKHKHTFLDRTAVTVVVKCADCPEWASLRFTTTEGWKAAAAHEERAHPERTQARDALVSHMARLARHAAAQV